MHSVPTGLQDSTRYRDVRCKSLKLRNSIVESSAQQDGHQYNYVQIPHLNSRESLLLQSRYTKSHDEAFDEAQRSKASNDTWNTPH